jgi:hypothetical protein
MGISQDEAREALATASRARKRVVDEIGLPTAYWWGMGAGWILLGVVAQFGTAWLTTLVTIAFGAGHAAVASRLLDGRRRTNALSVRAEVAGHRTALLVIGLLAALVALTVGLALADHADGAAHPAFAASLIPAVIVVLGGPRFVAWGQRRR